MNDMVKDDKKVEKYKLLALFGKSGAGKDYILNLLCTMRPSLFNKIIPYTTRPKRENEEAGAAYFFITADEMMEKILTDNSIISATVFKNWVYAVSLDSFVPSDRGKINIGVFNPTDIEYIEKDERIEVFNLMIDVPDNIRIARALLRETNPDIEEIFRRWKADTEDFFDIDDSISDYYVLDNSETGDKVSLIVKLEKVPKLKEFLGIGV